MLTIYPALCFDFDPQQANGLGPTGRSVHRTDLPASERISPVIAALSTILVVLGSREFLLLRVFGDVSFYPPVLVAFIKY